MNVTRDSLHLTKMLCLNRNSRKLNGSLLAYCSTSTKFVNNAQGGKTNFEKDFSESHINTTSFQKFLLGLGSGLMSITDPRRGDMVAVMGESTGAFAFEYIRSKMMESEEGRQILEEKPRISSASIDLKKLKNLPEGTLGKAYSNFLEKYKYTPDARLAVRFVDDFELAYVAQRYREAHDLFHTILDMPTNMLGEVTVKWVEAIQTRLPMCVTGAMFGPLRLAPKQRMNYITSYLPWAIQTGMNSGFLMNIYFEKRWEQPLSSLYQEYNIKPLKKKEGSIFNLEMKQNK
ncbi:UNVERIFIED_CONTAM: hypothetical protein PYX00_001219 [Menopon gallinae]|uniref:Ubiquinone biosynthesis protein COQ4 homolog, mitochondrial n=1 Tax=Menopon gallinae TaxID=328185 RepID=A0AAW2ICA4_9NEOP